MKHNLAIVVVPLTFFNRITSILMRCKPTDNYVFGIGPYCVSVEQNFKKFPDFLHFFSLKEHILWL